MSEERCFAVTEDGYVCTREAGHPVSEGHVAVTEGGSIGWVTVPDDITAGVSVCEHGKVMVFDPTYQPVPMAAPSFFCECCLQVTFYLASSMISWDVKTGEQHGHTTHVDTTLCPDCGGKTWTERF